MCVRVYSTMNLYLYSEDVLGTDIPVLPDYYITHFIYKVKFLLGNDIQTEMLKMLDTKPNYYHHQITTY